MDTVFDDFASLRWWISVVVVGLIINIASSYLRRYLDRRLAQLGAFVRRHSDRLSDRWSERVARIRSSERELILECTKEIRQRQAASLELLLATFGICFLLISAHGAFRLDKSTVFWTYAFIGVFLLESAGSLFRATLTREAIGAARQRQLP